MTGIIPLKKGENITSFFAVNKVRRLVGEKKAGHPHIGRPRRAAGCDRAGGHPPDRQGQAGPGSEARRDGLDASSRLGPGGSVC